MPDSQLHDLAFDHNPVEAIVGREPSWIVRSGISLIFIVILALLAITWFIEFPDTLVARITLTSEEPPTALVSRVSGRIQRLYVMDGEEVTKDQPIILIESDVYLPNLAVVENQLNWVKGNASWKAGPVEDLSNVTNIDQLGRLQAPYNLWLNSVESFFRLSRSDEYNVDALEIQALIRQYHALEQSLRNKRSASERKAGLNEDALKRYKELQKKGFVSSLEVLHMEAESLNQKSELEDLAIEVRLNGLKSKELEHQLEKLKFEYEEEKHQLQVAVEMATSTLSSSISDWKNDYFIRAPFAGKVSMNEYWSVNQYVTTGDTVVRITKKSNVMIGKLMLNPVGAGRIRKHQRVDIELDSFPALQFGILTGEVFGISSVANSDGYLVTVALPTSLRTSYNVPIENSPSLVGTAKIITNDRQLIERFFDRLLYVAN